MHLKTERNKLLRSIEKLLEPPMIFLGFVWLILLFIELVWGLPRMLEYLSITIWVVFIFDFLIKFILSTDRKNYMRRNWLTSVSLVIPAIRIFRVFRLLRLLKGVRLVRIVTSVNRSIKSLKSTMIRRGFAYIFLLTVFVIFAGAAGMYAIEKGHEGFENYWISLWWTSMRVITAGSEFWPVTPEGRGLAFMLALFGYGIFGYVTATLATFFIGRDAEENNTPVSGKKDMIELKNLILKLTIEVHELKKSQK